MKLFDELVKRGFTEFEARGLILAKKVRVNNEYQMSLNYKINDNDNIQIKTTRKYVSRGALKLKEILEINNINFADKTILDVGSSTGGFTQLALEYNAKHVFALDVGTNQLDYSLRIDKRVTSIEKTNFKLLDSLNLLPKIDIIMADVSFISIYYLIDIVKKYNHIRNLILLFKPQFEAPKEMVGQNGYVDESLHPELLKKFEQYLQTHGYDKIKIFESKLKGKKSNNQEYFFIIGF
ncbi:23S rRNA (cytidine1920-2'-O)/16S rRNA (cytidine1409-2'-O)-methyltransferase [Mycoplasma testudineum]|uniref:23S rRNA (Cytidine1920-2'-O)/16S rRNA (Cytidine1409-2'-O)-methyltransferase n=1 Tax=Mycoplasma testudineum TaxID=244584 RepID=A0A4R6IFU6_9MOLU|nr:TlyA family RNA methyltransferase [Mycoplasma testudineum]OYD26666.1 TlyA family rRNA (cytidine-2'-O)-methyltransferase [Mycoplasma testudineum]TDO19795.1 23S rRNA (cytidine1920-2'-O)/16S rRNA (cytidine1409-2'-O)-methyltransferase [Mycoplasma testudineum]